MAVNGIGVLDTVGAAVRFARANTRYAIGPLTLMAVAASVNLFGGYTNTPALGLAAVFQWAGSLMAMGALLRRAFANPRRNEPEDATGPAGFQWSNHEWRLLGSGVLLWVVFFGLILAACVVVVIMLAATGALPALSGLTPATSPEEFTQMLGPERMLGVFVMSLLFAVILIWIVMRLSLWGAATVYSRSVAIFSSWSLTKGRFWGVLLVMLIATLPTLALSILTNMVGRVMGHTAGMGVVLDPAAAAILSIVTAAVSAYIQLPLSVGAGAELYKKLAGAQAEAF